MMREEDSLTTARSDHRRHVRKKSSSGLNLLAHPIYPDDNADGHPDRPNDRLLSRLPFAWRKMRPSSRQLLVASTLICLCLFLYGRRLWSTQLSDVHDEWAKPVAPPQIPQPAEQPSAPDSSGPEDDKPIQQTALQQTPYHWNDYPLCVALRSSLVLVQ